MTSQREVKTKQVAELIFRLDRSFRTDLAEDWPNVELTMPQFRTLALLSNGSHRMSDIARSINSSLSSTTAMIDRLIEKGLVVREHDTIDRRVVTCRISDLGKLTLETFWQLQQDRVVATVNALTDDELDTVINALDILDHAAEKLANSRNDNPLDQS